MVKKVTINDTPLDNVVLDKPVKRTVKKQEIKEEESDTNESDIEVKQKNKDWNVGILDLVCDIHGGRKKESFNKYDKIMDDCKKTVNFHMNLKDDEDATQVVLESYEKKR